MQSGSVAHRSERDRAQGRSDPARLRTTEARVAGACGSYTKLNLRRRASEPLQPASSNGVRRDQSLPMVANADCREAAAADSTSRLVEKRAQ